MRVSDVISGLIIIVFSIWIIIEARSYPALPGVPYGPGLFPTVIAGAMILGGIVLVLKGARNLKETGWYSLASWATQGKTYITLGLIFSSLLFYILVSDRIGFLITSTVILLTLLLWTRGRRRLISTVVISVGFPLIVYILFSSFLRIPLPQGPFLGLF
jgi:putative tricarboxylic transport membrane protein